MSDSEDSVVGFNIPIGTLESALAEASATADPEQPIGETQSAEEGADEPTTEVQASDEDSGTEETEPTGEESEGDSDPPLSAPESWSDDDRTIFDSLDDDTRRWVLTREEAAASTQAPSSEQTAQYAALDAVLAPRRAQFAAQGVTDAQAVSSLLAAADRLAADPIQGLRYLAAHYGADLSAVAGVQPAATGESEGGDDALVDPEIAALRGQVSQLQERLNSNDARTQQQTQASVSAQVQAFVNATDEAGKPKHPYYNKVSHTMAALLSADRNHTLETAYQEAIWANAEIRKELKAAEGKAAHAASIKAKAEATAKAKKAKAVNVQSRPANKPGDSSDTAKLRGKFNVPLETLKEAFDSASNA